MSFNQENRTISVATPTSGDKLLFHRMTTNERLGHLFEFVVDLLSLDESILLYDVLGKEMTVKAPLPSGGERFFHGFVSRFTQVGRQGQFAKYEATLVPWFWFLTRNADCRIYQQKAVPDIVKEVFREKNFTDFEDATVGTYRVRDFCVQYRESDFSFISRLMEQEGIYYYFKHEAGRHVLVLADDAASHQVVSGYGEIPYYPPDDHKRREREHIFEWSVSQEVQAGAYALSDFDFERPRVDLLVTAKASQSHAHANYEVFEYPGEYVQVDDGTEYVKKRIEEQQADYERVRGSADACGLQAGGLFSLFNYPRGDQNREYLIVSTQQSLRNNEYETGGGDGASWECRLEAVDVKQPFRSKRSTPKPHIRGPQTAVVAGKDGEEIWTDKYGRVKVHFHWDRYGQSDENSSCWVRVAQLWAGKTWGALHIPRVGQEVIVEFLEGDPDRPIITGRVYNGDQMPPYSLPTNQTQSGIKSRASKGGPQNSNELRFEDKRNEEKVFLYAERDFERIVENNDTLKVGFEKSKAGDQVIQIFNNQQLTIGNSKSDDGSQKIEIWKNLTETVKTGDASLTISKGRRTATIEGDDALTIKTGDLNIAINSGKNEIVAAKYILLKVGGSSIKIEPAAITLKSVAINIQGEGTVDLKAPMTKCVGTGQLILKGGMTMIN